eukprot:SAG11_NODE_7539_length_1132_cov_0.879961_2_plen_129_part_00
MPAGLAEENGRVPAAAHGARAQDVQLVMIDRKAALAPGFAAAAHERAVLLVSQPIYSPYLHPYVKQGAVGQRKERYVALHVRDDSRRRTTKCAVHAQLSLPHLLEMLEEENRFAAEPCRAPAVASVPM